MTISRRKFQLVLVLLAAGLVWWIWPARSWRFANLPPRINGPWVAFGDSLTEGFGANSGADYPTQLSKLLGVPIQNRGVSGETSSDGLKRIAEIEALEPRVVLMCFGGNDVLRRLPSEEMFANLGAMIDRLQARGSFVVLIGIRGANVLKDSNAKAFVKLAEEKQVKHVPNILDGLLSKPKLMYDHVHPNDAGYSQIARRIEKELRPLLEQLKQP